MRVPDHVVTGVVDLGERARVAVDHGRLLARSIEHQRVVDGLATVRTARGLSIEEMCVTGLLGEYAVMVYLGLPMPREFTVGRDGGREVLVNGKNIQVKTAKNPEKFKGGKKPWMLETRSTRVRPEITDYVALAMPLRCGRRVEMVGCLVIADWVQKMRPFAFDPGNARGVPGEELMPMHTMWFAEVYKNAAD